MIRFDSVRTPMKSTSDCDWEEFDIVEGGKEKKEEVWKGVLGRMRWGFEF